ncbi:MAG: DNA gyrase C-terminal beta-propeller domain-containing protein [Verrucomicrobiota bacterium]|nr:DNA gyrase C-terminal beta-propeller domain-containing protein [Verrucomicrobiota bacterium]
MITKSGQAMRCPVINIRETNRGSKGVKLVDLRTKDILIGVSEVVELDEDMEDDSEIVEEVEGSDVILEEKPSDQ